MHAWPVVEIPTLPEQPGTLVLRDSLTGQDLPVLPTDGLARVYACGITPYDATHLGHAFTYVSVDLAVRVLADTGVPVRYVQNVTDVDDPLLERAEETGVDWEDLAASQVDLFRSDMAALRVVPPQPLLGVVESLPRIVEALEVLRRRGLLYQVDDPQYPDWYLCMDGLDLDALGLDRDKALALFADRGGDPDRRGKRSPLDSLAWRQHRSGEPAWESSLGAGRPGWHIECSAIATGVLGPAFDIQAGGSDLAFPHHPMCAWCSRALSGEPFARAYLHTGMVGLDGEKMSKSQGNLVFVSNLLASGIDPMTVRLLLLGQRYARDWEYSAAALVVAEHRRISWQRAFSRPAALPAEPVLAAVRSALRRDLDAPAALALIDEWAQQDSEDDPAAPSRVAAVADALLGVKLG